MVRKANHIHRLKKHKYSTGSTIFFCILPDCHYKIDSALALGKKSICNICGNEFIMNEYSLKLVKPHCNECGKVRVKDGNGKHKYIKKVTNQVLTSIAFDSNRELRERLETIAPVIEDDNKDI